MGEHILSSGQAGAEARYDWKQDRRLLFGSVGAAVLATGAFVTGLPIGFYMFERWYVCLVAAVIAYSEERQQRPLGALVAVAVAMIFNPFVPLHLERTIWMPIDIATAAWLTCIAVERLFRPMPKRVQTGALIGAACVGLVACALIYLPVPRFEPERGTSTERRSTGYDDLVPNPSAENSLAEPG